MASGGGRTLAALLCVVAVATVAAPAASSSASSHRSAVVALESGLLQQLNAVRSAHGLSALHANTRLAAAATAHSREMADDGYFRHDSFDGTSFSARIAHWYPASGYRSWIVGENLLWSSPGVGVAGAVAAWMRSPGHRRNILDPRWREIGIGAVHLDAAGGAYRDLPVTIVTTDFGVRR